MIIIFSRDKEDVFELGDHVAFVTHGDVYGVSWGEEELVSRAQEMGADVVFYGAYALSGISCI